MSDINQSRKVPNGIVVAAPRLVYPALVGADIGCGIAAVRFHVAADDHFLELARADDGSP